MNSSWRLLTYFFPQVRSDDASAFRVEEMSMVRIRRHPHLLTGGETVVAGQAKRQLADIGGDIEDRLVAEIFGGLDFRGPRAVVGQRKMFGSYAIGRGPELL